MINVASNVPEGSSVEQEVDSDITAFETYFCTNIDSSAGALTGPERAIIKTYLAFKLGIGPVPQKTE